MKSGTAVRAGMVTLQRRIQILEGRLKKVRHAHKQAVREIRQRVAVERVLGDQVDRSAMMNRDFDRLVSLAAHDLQEPLHAMSVFLDLLKIKCGHRLGMPGNDYLRRAQCSAVRMTQLVQGLLAYSKIGNAPLQIEPVPLSRLVDAVLSDLQGTIQETGGNVRVGRLPTVYGQAGHLRLVFHHLIQNAIKFRRPGHPPVVTICGQLLPERRQCRSEAPGMLCRVDIQDQGIGLAEEQAGKIFQLFQRLHRYDEYDGVGIGLAVCQRIIERHGGSISVKSSLGQGATFTVTLPVFAEGDGL
jgi:light-regulated signal transduction histidine kinase (bacteriophytochrome)